MDSASLMARYAMMLTLVSDGETVSFGAFTISKPSNVVDLAAVRQVLLERHRRKLRTEDLDDAS
jgi:hypothetical protein